MRGVRLGVDVGAVRIGLAVSDPNGLVATPVATIARTAEQPETARASAPTAPRADLAAIAAEVTERSAVTVYVGLPRHLSGAEGAAAADARTFAAALAQVIAPVPVRLVDERLTTVSAHQALHAAGRAGRRHREVVDQAAAVIILQTALETEHAHTQRAAPAVPCAEPERDPAPGAHDRKNGQITGDRPRVDRAGTLEDPLR